MKIIEFKNVWENYRTKFVLGRKNIWKEIQALEDINFSVEKGETLGVIGENGAGKTTLLKLIAGMIKPDKGEVKTEGRILALMEIGAGFHSDLTGRENIYLNASLYGIDRKQMNKRIGEIIGFAEIGKFIDAPIRCYSQGMYLRLAFALAVHVDPDVLLIDDILVVGDEDAQTKCFDKILKLKNSGKTVVLVSHAMNMIYKLCDRVIFLKEGCLIQEGSCHKVVSRYLETVGQNEGIGKIEKGDLRVIFNNGKLFISWKNAPLTKHFGGYASFCHLGTNTWHFSANADWKVTKLGMDEISARGIYRSLSTSQIWEIRVKNNSELELKVNIESEETSIKEKQVGLFLSPEYKQWFGLDGQGEFPPFYLKRDWQQITPDSYRGNVLAVGSNSSADGALPFLALEVKKDNCFLKTLNTGYAVESRLMQERLLGERQFYGKIKIFFKEEDFKDYLQTLKGQYQTKREITKGYLKVCADVDNRNLAVFYKDKEVTEGGGFFSFIEIPGVGRLVSDQFLWDWEFIKKSSGQMMIILRYKLLGLTQIWTLTCCKKNILEINIDLETENKPFLLINQGVVLKVAGRYTRWKTPYEEWTFSTKQYVGDVGIIKMKHNKVSEIFLEGKDNSCFPKLFFGCSDSENARILGIDRRKNNQERDGEDILICFSKLTSRKNQEVFVGKHHFFSGRMIFDQDVPFKQISRKSLYQITKGNLKVVFDEGRGRIFWQNKELTLGLGVYTSIRSSGIWCDSAQAIWHAKVIGENDAVLVGNWNHVPVLQVWEFKIISENLIYWKVGMEIYGQVNLELEQSNLMLSDEYKDWFIPEMQEGKFLDEFTEDYDISPFRFWYGKINGEGMGTRHRVLPSVLFKLKMKNGSYRAVIENTDYLHKARMLQYQRIAGNKTASGEYKYFEGTIEIGSQS